MYAVQACGPAEPFKTQEGLIRDLVVHLPIARHEPIAGSAYTRLLRLDQLIGTASSLSCWDSALADLALGTYTHEAGDSVPAVQQQHATMGCDIQPRRTMRTAPSSIYDPSLSGALNENNAPFLRRAHSGGSQCLFLSPDNYRTR